mgnify:FL=1
MINKEKIKDLEMNEIFEEIKKDMDDFFTEIDKAIGREPVKKTNVTINRNLWKNRTKKLKNN